MTPPHNIDQIDQLATGFKFETALAAEHARLTRLCAHLTGDRDAAEDLAQETLIEAWRNRHKLINPEGYAAWLSAIARNVCLRWQRRQGREYSRRADLIADDDPINQIELLPADFDIEMELEHQDLVTLLDRALALLPDETRTVLVERFVQESPLAEVAARLGISEGAVAVRIHRGKLALTRVLTASFRTEAAAYGLVDATMDDAWQSSKIWCPACGKHQLMGVIDRQRGSFALVCPGCSPNTALVRYQRRGGTNLLDGARSFKNALGRVLDWTRDRNMGLDGLSRCMACGNLMQLMVSGGVGEDSCVTHLAQGRCSSCGSFNTLSLNGLALSSHEGQTFWRDHQRIRVLPDQVIESDGSLAILTTFESVGNTARLSATIARDTLRILRIETN